MPFQSNQMPSAYSWISKNEMLLLTMPARKSVGDAFMARTVSAAPLVQHNFYSAEVDYELDFDFIVILLVSVRKKETDALQKK